MTRNSNSLTKMPRIGIILFLIFLTTKSYLCKIIPPSCNFIMMKWARGFLQVQAFFIFLSGFFSLFVWVFFRILGIEDEFFFFFHRHLYLNLLLRMSLLENANHITLTKSSSENDKNLTTKVVTTRWDDEKKVM